MARSNEIIVIEDEVGKGEPVLRKRSRIGLLVPLYRDRRSFTLLARRAEFKDKLIALIEATRDRTKEKEDEVAFGVGQLENPFPIYRFL